jgi:low affinity Fe/Cu permease
MNEVFRKVANKISLIMGTPWAFMAALLIIIVWAACGPLFHFQDTWQLVINTSTTIITFLMVFLIQNTQNRDSRAEQVKLDELLRSIKGARNSFVNIEDIPDKDLKMLQEQFKSIHDNYEKELVKRGKNKKKKS